MNKETSNATSSKEPLGMQTGSIALQREKNWAESSVEEKLEKIRREIINQSYTNNNLFSIRKDISKLMKHEHSVNGSVVIKLEQDYGLE